MQNTGLKKNQKKKKAASFKQQAGLDIIAGIMYDEFKYDNFDRQNFSITVVGPEDNLQKGPHEMKEVYYE